MSNPISSLPEKPDDEPLIEGEEEPALEVEDLLDENPPASLTDFETTASDTSDASDASDASASESSPAAESTAEETGSNRGGLLLLVVAGLLLVSIAINLKQSGDVGRLEAERAELQQALDGAVERIDVETARANGAEAALDRVDRAVDVVNERVLGLQEALDGLREATVR